MCSKYGDDDGYDAEEHDDTLYKVVHGCCLISAQDDVDSRQNSHDDNAIFVGNTEAHLKKGGDAFVDTCRVGDEEHKGYNRGNDTQSLVGIASTEEVGHRTTLDMLCHQFGASSQEDPRQQGADDGIAHSYPRTGQTVSPSELACIAHEDYGRKVTRSEGKGGEPRTHRASSQHETVDTAGLFAGINADTNHHGQEDEGQQYFDNHNG